MCLPWSRFRGCCAPCAATSSQVGKARTFCRRKSFAPRKRTGIYWTFGPTSHARMRLRSRTRCCHASTERWRVLAFAPKIGREQPEFSGTPRSFVVRPYVVFYEPLSEDHGIVVWRIIHGARDLQRLIRPPDR